MLHKGSLQNFKSYINAMPLTTSQPPVCTDSILSDCENNIGSYNCLPNRLPIISFSEVKR